MIITCPNCSSRFVVKAEAIGDKGRNVRCAKCSHKWFQQPDQDALEAAKNIAEEPKETTPLKKGANVPAKAEQKAPIYLKICAAAMIALMLVSISLVNANKLLPSLSFYYNLLGIYDTSKLALNDVKAIKTNNDNNAAIKVSGKIVNNSSTDKYTPNLRISVYGDKKTEVKNITINSENKIIKPGNEIEFENHIDNLPMHSSLVIVDIGNKLDLAVR